MTTPNYNINIDFDALPPVLQDALTSDDGPGPTPVLVSLTAVLTAEAANPNPDLDMLRQLAALLDRDVNLLLPETIEAYEQDAYEDGLREAQA